VALASFRALRLSSEGEAVTAADLGVPLDGTVPFSVDAWVYFDGLAAHGVLLAQEDGFAFFSQGSRLAFQIEGLPAVYSDPLEGELSDQAWHFLTATYAQGTTTLFIDGAVNRRESSTGVGKAGSEPFKIGAGIDGRIRLVRVYNTALGPNQVVANQFEVPDPATLVAGFDFRQSPPQDTGPGHLPLVLGGDAQMVESTPALELSDAAYAMPLAGEAINPGGWGNDSYTVQSWIWLDPSAPPAEMVVFTNGELASSTGMTLELLPSSSGYRLAAIRGPTTTGDTQTSTATVPTGRWTNVATTFDGVTATLYVDGVAGGSASAAPIPQTQASGDPLIGGSRVPSAPRGQATLQGFVARTDVWTRSLSEAEIEQYLESPPALGSEGLAGSWDFSSSPAQDLVTGNPVALADGARLGEETQPAAPGADEGSEEPQESFRGVPLRELLDEVDLSGALGECEEALGRGAELDAARFARTPQQAERIRAAYADTASKLREGPRSAPFLVTDHEVDGRWIVVAHTPQRSWLLFEAAADQLDACTRWRIRLFVTVVAGVVLVVVGVPVKATLVDSPAVQRLILTVFATAGVGVQLGKGTEPSAGMLLDVIGATYETGRLRQLLNLLLNVSYWAMFRILTRMIAVALGVGAADLISSLATAVAAVVVTWRERPSSCDPPETVQISGIIFNWDPTMTAVNSYPVRHDLTTPSPPIQMPIPTPATAAEGGAPTDPLAINPVLYSIADAQRGTPTVLVSFRTSDLSTHETTIFANRGGVLGPIGSRKVTFANGRSVPEWIPMRLSNNRLSQGGVGRTQVEWQWFSERSPQQGARSIGISQHTVYVTLAPPTGPWQIWGAPANTQLPWTTALDFACAWTQGATTAEEAISRITRQVYGALELTYASKGLPHLTWPLQFDLSSFLLYLNRRRTDNQVNCSDCAAIVATFSGLLGVFAPTVRLGNASNQPFKCNEILAIGTPGWSIPFKGSGPGEGTFAFHEVARGMGWPFEFPLWDACLAVDGGTSPWKIGPPHVPQLPLGLAFSSNALISAPPPLPPPFNLLTYRERLASNDPEGFPLCWPLYMSSLPFRSLY
jgi:hypothetical protein